MSSIVTVQQQAVSRRFVEPSYVRAMLGLSQTDINDTNLDALIEGACAFVESWCNRKGEMFYEVVSEQFRLSQSTESIYLRRYPVVSITSVSESGIALGVSDWEVDYETGRLARLDGSDGAQRWGYPVTTALRVTVVYGAGYFADDDTGGNIPPDLRDGALEIIKGNWFNLDRDPYERSVEVPGLATVAFGFGAASQSQFNISPEAERYLTPYRRLALA